MGREALHKFICSKNQKLCAWYDKKAETLNHSIYSSYDIRDAGFKVSNVDANIFPAGFNNICPTDKETSVELMNHYLNSHYGSNYQRILLVTEEHTNNPYYWENVNAIKKMMEASGRQVLVAIPKNLGAPISVTTVAGETLQVHSAFEGSSSVKEFSPQLVVSNNDFSDANEEWAQQLSLPMNPPRELGWYQRKKDRYFKFYNQLVEEFADVGGFDPFYLNVKTEFFQNFDTTDEKATTMLADRVDHMISELKKEYKKHKIDQEPFVFIKNNSGTYGLAVLNVKSGAEVKELNYKSRKKMKAAKGGRDVEEVILQEGIPTRVEADGATAEPVIYMIGQDLAGGFLRTHADKSSTESLNSPGAVYKRLCTSDLLVSVEGSPLENVYGWSAKLGLLAISLEAKEMNVSFKDYKHK